VAVAIALRIAAGGDLRVTALACDEAKITVVDSERAECMWEILEENYYSGVCE